MRNNIFYKKAVKLIFTDIESKSKIDINTIINAEYIRTKVPITFNPITNIFRDIRFLILMEVDDILPVTLYSKGSIIFSDGPPVVLDIFRRSPQIFANDGHYFIFTKKIL